MRRRVLADRCEDAPQVDDMLSIQSEFGDGGAPGRRQPDQFGEIAVPSEMLVPEVLARVEERDLPQGQRIKGRELGVLDVVATLTGEREIVCDAGAACFNRDDVFI